MPKATSPRDTSYALDGPQSKFEPRAVGAALIDADSLDQVVGGLVPGDIVDDGCRAVLETINELVTEGRQVTPAAVATRLEVSRAVVDPSELVRSLIGQAAPRTALADMLDGIKSASMSRLSMHAGQLLITATQVADADPAGVREAISAAQESLSVLSDGDVDDEWKSLGQATYEMINSGPTDPICATGLDDLDGILQGGLRPGQLVVVAGRPAMGKSTLAFDFCRHASLRESIPSVYVSLEMSSRELASRLVSAEASIDMSTVQSMDIDRMPARDRDSVLRAYERISQAPMDVVDPVDASWPVVAGHIRAAHRRAGGGPMIVVLDYLGLISQDARAESRQQALQEISRRSKQLAKNLGIAVILVAQLNRGPELRADHKPMMADLRETGSLEQDADIILLVYRPDYYEITDRTGEAQIIVAKHRNGTTGAAWVAFQGHYSRFAPLAKDITPPPPDY